MNPGSGEADLDTLLAGLAPLLRSPEYVFCSVPLSAAVDVATSALATFREEEGMTLVLERKAADDAGLDYGPTMRCITLQVHSSLEAVGLTAAVSSALAQAGISANVIAAYHHDHVFVPASRADDAMRVLNSLPR